MEAITAVEKPKPSNVAVLLQFMIVAFQRILALIFVLLTVLVWLRAVGFWEASGMRFDLMDAPNMAYTALLAVMFPVASVGLWTTLSWGRVVWFLAAGVQLLAFAGFSDRINVEIPLLTFHAFAISFFLAMMLGLRFIEKKE